VFKDDANEATPILQRALRNLLGAVPTSGLSGSDLRTACRLLSANAEQLLYFDQAGPPLSNCFELARQNGATQSQIEWVRQQTELEAPATVGATMVANSIMRLCLAPLDRGVSHLQVHDG
jgi:hypothetical protein